MATVKINNINTFNNTVLDLKSKIESSLKTNITSINSVFSSIENYRNDGFNANIGDIANTLKSNLESILKNITNAETNLFNYAEYINQFNVDDYDTEAKPTNLENLYNEKYLGIVSETKEENQKSQSEESGDNNYSGESSFVVLGDTSSNTDSNNYSNNTSSTLENYLGNVQGTTIPINNNLTYNTVSLNITNPNSTNPNTLTIVNNQAFNQEGLATFQDRYIISTSKDFGMVGDLIDITHNDGTVLKCIIGNVEENLTTPTINFVVNPDTFKTPLTTIHPNWLNSINEVKNKGNYFNYIK